MRALIRRYIEEAATQEWPILAQHTATLRITPGALAEALHETEGQKTARREIGRNGTGCSDECPRTVACPQQERRNLVAMIIFDPALGRGVQMIIDLDSWEAGYDDGLRGRPSQCVAGLDGFSYSSGYCQARAYRRGTRQAVRYPQSSTQRAFQRRGGRSRLIVL